MKLKHALPISIVLFITVEFLSVHPVLADPLVQSAKDVVRSKTWYLTTLNGQPSGFMNLTHIFFVNGTVLVYDQRGYSFYLDRPVAPSGALTVSLWFNSSHVAYHYFYAVVSNTVADVWFYYDFVSGKDRVKITIQGSLAVAGTVRLPLKAVNATSKQGVSQVPIFDSVGKRFLSGRYLPFGFEGVGFDWSDMLVSNSFDNATSVLSFTVGTSFNIDPSTVGTSTSNGATYMPFQRKVFYAAGRHWVCYMDGTDNVYSSSLDGVTWAATITLHAGVNLPTWFYNASHVAYACTDGLANGHIYYRLGTPQTDGSITWADGEQTAVTGVGETPNYVNIAIDSGGYPWIGYRMFGGASTGPRVTKSQWNNGSWSTQAGFPYVPTAISDLGECFVTPVPQTNQNVYLLYQRRNDKTLNGKQWYGSNSTWNAEETVTTLTIGYPYTCYSAVNQGDDLHLVFGEYITNYLQYVKRTYTTGTWSTNTTVQASTTATTGPVLSNTLANTLYCFWAGSPTANHIYYKKCVGGSWDAAATDWILDNPLSDNDRLTCSYQASSGVIGLLYMANTSSPYGIRYATLTENYAPTIGVPTSTSWDDTDNCYAQKKSYTASVTYTDANGYADIHYCELYLKTGANVTRASFQYHEDDNTVSTPTGGTEWTLDSVAADFSRSDNNIVASWKFSAQWDATEESDLDFLFNVVDSAGASANSVSDQNFDVVTRLVVSGLTSADSRINIGATTTIGGTVYYGNNPGSNTPSTSYPPDAEFTSVSVHDSAHAVQATDNTIVNGAFSVSYAIPSSVQSNTYHAYINMADADYADVDSVEASTTIVSGDRIRVDTLSKTDADGRINVNTVGTFYAMASLELDGHALGSGDSLTLSTYAFTWDSVDSRFEYNSTQGSVTSLTVNSFTSGNEVTYGITAGNINGKSATLVWDQVMVYYMILDDAQNRTDINSNFEFRVRAELLYDHHPLGSGDTVTANFGVLSWNATNGWFAGSRTQGTVGDYTFQVSSLNEATYGITAFTSNCTNPLGIWDTIEIYEKDEPVIQISANSVYESIESYASWPFQSHETMWVTYVEVDISNKVQNHIFAINWVEISLVNATYSDGTVENLGIKRNVPMNRVLSYGQGFTQGLKLKGTFSKPPTNVGVKVEVGTQGRATTQVMTMVVATPSSIQTPQTSQVVVVLNRYPLLVPAIILGVPAVLAWIFWPRKTKAKHHISSRLRQKHNDEKMNNQILDLSKRTFSLFLIFFSLSTLYCYVEKTDGLFPKHDIQPISLTSDWKVVNFNPTLNQNEGGWYPQTSHVPLGFTIAQTRWCSELGQGFCLTLKAGFIVNPIMATTWTEAGIGEPDEHPNPQNPVILATDLPLMPADHWSFRITSYIANWQPAINSYLECGFGGWILLDQPYTVLGTTHRAEYPRIIELMFAVRTDDNIEAGNGKWSRLYWRSGDGGPLDQGWLICQYAMSKQEIGTWQTQNLEPDVFAKLIEELSEPCLHEINPSLPLFHSVQNTLALMGTIVFKGINLTNSRFRFAYVDLEGGNDFVSLGVSQADLLVNDMYVLHKEKC